MDEGDGMATIDDPGRPLRAGWREADALREVIRHLAATPHPQVPDHGQVARLVEAALSDRAPCPDCTLGFVPEYEEGLGAVRTTCSRCDGLMFVGPDDPERGHPEVDPAVVAELELLEEVCALYSRDEDRHNRSEGASEAYGSIPTDAGLKARSARARFDAREAEAERVERVALERTLREAATDADRETAAADLADHDEVAAIRRAVREGRGPFD